MKRLVVLLSIAFLVACAHLRIDQAITAYDSVADQIRLGDSKEEVLTIFQPIIDKVTPAERKRAEQYKQDGILVEIIYMRSANYVDGLVTDDEFIPYVFHDGVLVGIGWQILGGPKTQGQVQPSSTYIHAQGTYIY